MGDRPRSRRDCPRRAGIASRAGADFICYWAAISLISPVGASGRAHRPRSLGDSGVVLDLGVSSFQLDLPAHGLFSFPITPGRSRYAHGPCRPRPRPTSSTPCRSASWPTSLCSPSARRASRRIAQTRACCRPHSGADRSSPRGLAEIIRTCRASARSLRHRSRDHSFQALRIRVNDWRCRRSERARVDAEKVSSAAAAR